MPGLLYCGPSPNSFLSMTPEEVYGELHLSEAPTVAGPFLSSQCGTCAYVVY